MDAFRCLFPFVDKDFRCGRVLIGNRHTYACASGIDSAFACLCCIYFKNPTVTRALEFGTFALILFVILFDWK